MVTVFASHTNHLLHLHKTPLRAWQAVGIYKKTASPYMSLQHARKIFCHWFNIYLSFLRFFLMRRNSHECTARNVLPSRRQIFLASRYKNSRMHDTLATSCQSVFWLFSSFCAMCQSSTQTKYPELTAVYALSFIQLICSSIHYSVCIYDTLATVYLRIFYSFEFSCAMCLAYKPNQYQK